jgi:GST-like protein
VKEATRLYGVLEGRLAEAGWLAGGDYGIADMAVWGFVWFHRMHGQDLEDFPAISRWFSAISARPAVQRARSLALDRLPADARARLSGPYFGASA